MDTDAVVDGLLVLLAPVLVQLELYQLVLRSKSGVPVRVQFGPCTTEPLFAVPVAVLTFLDLVRPYSHECGYLLCSP